MGDTWNSMDTAPKGVTIRVKLADGQHLLAHFAQDLRLVSTSQRVMRVGND